MEDIIDSNLKCQNYYCLFSCHFYVFYDSINIQYFYVYIITFNSFSLNYNFNFFVVFFEYEAQRGKFLMKFDSKNLFGAFLINDLFFSFIGFYDVRHILVLGNF